MSAISVLGHPPDTASVGFRALREPSSSSFAPWLALEPSLLVFHRSNAVTCFQINLAQASNSFVYRLTLLISLATF